MGRSPLRVWVGRNTSGFTGRAGASLASSGASVGQYLATSDCVTWQGIEGAAISGAAIGFLAGPVRVTPGRFTPRVGQNSVTRADVAGDLAFLNSSALHGLGSFGRAGTAAFFSNIGSGNQ